MSERIIDGTASTEVHVLDGSDPGHVEVLAIETGFTVTVNGEMVKISQEAGRQLGWRLIGGPATSRDRGRGAR